MMAPGPTPPQQPTPGQTQEVRQAISDLHAECSQFGEVELREDYDGDLYLSWPVGHNEAVEVETYSTSTLTFFTLTHRRWDRTGGMSYEEELGETGKPLLVKAMVDAILKDISTRDRKLEAALGVLTEED